MKKTIAVLTVLLLLVASAVYLVRHQHHVISAEAPPSTWNVVIHDRTLSEEAAHLTRPAVADVEAMEQTVLSSRLSGYVTRMPLFEGSRFKRGDLLATIDMSQSDPGQSQGNSLKADLASARIAQVAAQEHLQRSRRLYQVGGLSLEQLQVDEAALAAAQAHQMLAQENLHNATLIAPFDGVIAARLAQPGDLATPGKPLLRIVALGPQRVLVDTPDQTAVAGLLLDGKNYPVHPWPEATLQGLRRWEARVSNLMPGSKVDVNIVTFDGRGIFIPGDCMLNNDGRRADLVRLPAKDKGSASVQSIDLLAIGVQGAVAASAGLAGARIACASPDVLNRLAGGTTYNISGAH
jgi:multidrug efflux pump subunit AcrA (membrane-fusion protein)